MIRLQDTMDLLASVIEASPLAIVGLDLDSRVTLWNNAAAQMFGWSRDEVLGSTPPVIPSADRDEHRRLLARAASGEAQTQIESRRRRRDGSVIDVAVSSAPIRDSDGQIRGILRIITDIGEQKRLRMELEARVRQQEAVAAFGQRALSLLDLSPLFDEAVTLVTSTLGLDRCAITELCWDEPAVVVRGSSGLAPVGSRLSRAVERTVAWRVAHLAQPLVVEDVRGDPQFDGTPLVDRFGAVSLLSVPIHGAERGFGNLLATNGHPRSFTSDEIVFAQSIANVLSMAIERARTEEALLGSEERLRQAQKMEAIGQLAGGIAHDFNNLLTVINGFCDLLVAQPNHPERVAYMEEVMKAGEQAASLTSQLLAFSRRQVLQPRVLDLNKVVDDMKTLLGRILGEDIEVTAKLDPHLGSVRADRSQIGQVILNLAANARDAMPTGGELVIETANVEIDASYTDRHEFPRFGHHVLLSISDTGTGMDLVLQDHLFEPFFTTKEPGKGTGLGLAMVYGIVKQSDGDIWVYSEPGVGTTFKIYLPLYEELGSTPPAAASGATRARRGETVLVVEDAPGVRALASTALVSQGYTVLEASRGSDAISLCARYVGLIDLVVTDLVMPGMSGLQLATELATLRPETKVLYMSGYSDEVAVRHGLVEPSVPYLQKPFTPTSLAQKVREVLDADVVG